MSSILRSLLAGLGCAVLVAAGSPAFAICTVTLKFKNDNGDAVTVRGDDSQARVNGGLWSKMGFPDTEIQAGATASVPWKTNMSCGGNAQRDLRFKYAEDSSNKVFEEMVNNIDIADGQTVNVTLKF